MKDLNTRISMCDIRILAGHAITAMDMSRAQYSHEAVA